MHAPHFTTLFRVLSIALSAFVVASCSGDEAANGTAIDGQWTEVADAPLEARNEAVLAAVGDELIVFGGNDYTCPPDADCVTPDRPPLADGAAFNIETQTWRRIADAPTGIQAVKAVTIDTAVYALIQCQKSPRCPSGPATLSYDVVTDSWTWLSGVPVDDGWHHLVVADGNLFAISSSDEREMPDFRYKPDADTWLAVPASPMPLAFDRFAVESAGALVLYGSPINGENDNKMVALYDLDSNDWTALGEAPSGGWQPFEVDGDVVLNPHFGSATGGIHDVATNSWTALPKAPEADSWRGDIAGVIGKDTAEFEYSYGWVLDTPTDSWIEIPRADGDFLDGESVTAIGTSLFVFGGHYWTDGDVQVDGGSRMWTR